MLFQKKPMDGRQYEVYVAEFLREQGFRDIQTTPATGDYGVDLLARHGRHRYAVQCKFYTQPVGGAAVQQAVAGMAYYGCEKALVVTSSHLTKNARELARVNGVDVLEYVDPEARTFLERRKPWQLVLLAAEAVVFGLFLQEMLRQGPLQWRSLLLLAALCFPCPYLAIWLGKLLLRLADRGEKRDV